VNYGDDPYIDGREVQTTQDRLQLVAPRCSGGIVDASSMGTDDHLDDKS